MEDLPTPLSPMIAMSNFVFITQLDRMGISMPDKRAEDDRQVFEIEKFRPLFKNEKSSSLVVLREVFNKLLSNTESLCS